MGKDARAREEDDQMRNKLQDLIFEFFLHTQNFWLHLKNAFFLKIHIFPLKHNISSNH